MLCSITSCSTAEVAAVYTEVQLIIVHAPLATVVVNSAALEDFFFLSYQIFFITNIVIINTFE